MRRLGGMWVQIEEEKQLLLHDREHSLLLGRLWQQRKKPLAARGTLAAS